MISWKPSKCKTTPVNDNITVISNLSNVLHQDPTRPLSARHQAVTCLAILGFFWLLRPAEYLDGAGKTRSQSFRLCDVTFEINGATIPATDASLNDVDVNHYTRASLMFYRPKERCQRQSDHACRYD
jgi:hypothetical protein